MSGKKKYSNFEEVDRDLKRLYLQSEISKEELKLSFHLTKESAKPSKLITGLIGGVATSTLLLKLLMPLFSFGIGKFLKKYR